MQVEMGKELEKKGLDLEEVGLCVFGWFRKGGDDEWITETDSIMRVKKDG